jgi:peptide/nickel transport system substrate-binding protein
LKRISRAASAALLSIPLAASVAAAAEPSHALAMRGEPLYPADFKAFAYVNPDAPKGGRVTYGVLGSFDSLNPFTVRGEAARGMRDGGHENYVIESLMTRGLDEAFTLYCLLCRTVEVPDDRSWVEFKLRPEARFSDGAPVTAADVAFSFEVLKEHGRPNVTIPYKKVVEVATPDPETVRFVFKDGSDRELALIMASMPVFAKHKITPDEFPKASLTPLTGSGPYVVGQVEPGARVVLKANPDYWGRALPVNRGFNNYDEIRFDYYRNDNSLFEAFKAGLIDVLPEGDPSRWTTRYDFPAVQDGRVVKDSFETALPKGMYGLVFNTRRPIFADVRVREAIAMLFDFEWVNKNIYSGLYRRTGSYFEGSALASPGHPTDAREREILAPFPNAVRADMMAGTWRPVATDGSGRDRLVLRNALALFGEAGWKFDKGALRNAAGEAFSFELVVATQDQERIATAFQRNLKQVGADARIRLLDSAQFTRRWQTFDFDMMPWSYTASLSPGNEQLQRWSVRAAETPGSFNLAGAVDKAQDATIEAMLEANTSEGFEAATRALDRVLLSGFYVVPLFHKPDQWIARWTRIARPEKTALWGAVIASWWVKPTP